MKTVKIKKETIDSIFETATDQETALIALYKVAFPAWDKIKKIHGWPSVNKSTWKRICSKFMVLDGKYHPEVLAGGCWMNTGFSSMQDEELKDNLICIDGVSVEF